MAQGSRFAGALPKPGQRGKSDNALVVSTRPARRVVTRNRYDELKETIRTWLSDRFRVAEALKEIHAEKLYKKEYATFEEFCMDEYGIQRAHAYRLIEAADVKASVSPIGDKITTESQARELAKLPVKQRVKVLRQVIAKGSVTAKAIREASPKAIDVEPITKPITKHCIRLQGNGVVVTIEPPVTVMLTADLAVIRARELLNGFDETIIPTMFRSEAK